MLVSGDIAQSGKAPEYAIAARFLKTLKATITAEFTIDVDIVVCPGNHDCDFKDDPVRTSVLKDLVSYLPDVPESVAARMCEPQLNFREFCRQFTDPESLLYEDNLWSILEFSTEGKTIWIDVLNTAWMSTRQEKQGTLLFPYGRASYGDFRATDADIRIGLMHHPLNWFHVGNYQGLKKFLQTLEDVLITGHEHDGNLSSRLDASSGDCIFVEGACLQNSNHGDSAFSVLEIDIAEMKLGWTQYVLDNGTYESPSDTIWAGLRQHQDRRDSDFHIAAKFASELTDPGATLHHPEKSVLQLDDFYIYPDLDSQDGKSRADRQFVTKRFSSQRLTHANDAAKRIILEGAESAGKTRLLHQFFRAYHHQGFIPTFVNGRSFKSSHLDDIRKVVESAVREQYAIKNIEAWRQTSRHKKTLFIDDFDTSPLQPTGKQKLLGQLDSMFERIIITVGDNFAIAEIFLAEKNDTLLHFEHFKILPFGYERRGDLVRKWNRLGMSEVVAVNDWLEACTKYERLIEAAQLQHIASTVPIMVLSLLNARSTSLTREAQNSSLAHYFYFLIVGALEKVGVKPEVLQKYLNFCMHLSWFIKEHGAGGEITDLAFRDFCQQYTKAWSTVDATEMLDILVRARIMQLQADLVSFNYQYSYYYFLGRYASHFSSAQAVQTYLDYCVANLYVRECANTLLFVAHHSNDADILDRICTSLNKYFSDVLPVTFAKEDVNKISKLMGAAPRLKYSYRAPLDHRVNVERMKDDHAIDDGLAERPRDEDKTSFLDELTSVIKTIEIAGALVTNQFANLSRETKNSSIRTIFSSALRLIAEFYELVSKDPETLIKEITAKLSQRDKDLTDEQAERISRRAIATLLTSFSTNVIIKAGAHLLSGEIKDNIDEVVDGWENLAVKLIRLSQQLSGPGRLPQGSIKAIIRGQEDNPCVMSVTQMLVLNRLYMYETEYNDKDWAVATFELGRNANKSVGYSDRQKRIGQGR